MAQLGMHTGTPRVLIVDDNLFNRIAVADFLRQQGYLVDEAGNEAEGLACAVAHKPDIAIVDIVIPRSADCDPDWRENAGIDLVVSLKRRFPNLGIVVFSGHTDRAADLFRCFQAGMRGIAYKLKGCTADELLDAIHSVTVGRVLFDQGVTAESTALQTILASLSQLERDTIGHGLTQFEHLTDRQIEVAELAAASNGNRAIAEQVGLSEKTAANYVSEIYSILGLMEAAYEKDIRKEVLLSKLLLIHRLGGWVTVGQLD